MYGVGIDLGTSFAAAAIGHAGTLDMVRLDGQSTVTPAVAYLDDTGALLTGEAADRLGLADPRRVAREFKRRLGDPTPVILGGTPFSPAALMAALLRTILDTVTEDQQAPPDHVVLTHPAVWGAYRREHFATIPRLAGLPESGTGPTVVTTTEPVAAATYYCSTHPLPPAGLLAVYDLGGGTFDSAVVRNGRDGLEIVGTPEGIEWLGGTDFDQAILDQVDRQLGGAIGRLDPGDPGAAALLAALHRECTLAKEALSTRPQADVTVSLPDGVRHVTIARDTFEQMITPALDTTVEAFRRTLTASGITPQDLTAVLLVGGSSQIPRVTELLRDTLRRPILINTHPKHAVALGAAMLSADALARRDAPPGRRPGRRGPASPTAALSAPAAALSAPAVATAATAPEATDIEAPQAPADRTGAAAWTRWRSPRILVPALAAAVALVLVVVLVIVPKLAGGGTPACGGTDAALHRPATASSTEGAGYPASNAVDGVGTTRWGSEFSDPQWLQVDLGAPTGVCGVRIDWESAYASAFQLQVSADAVNWTTVYATAAGTGATQRLTVSGTGRYVRLYLTGRATGYGYSLWEFAVFTTGTPPPVAGRDEMNSPVEDAYGTVLSATPSVSTPPSATRSPAASPKPPKSTRTASRPALPAGAITGLEGLCIDDPSSGATPGTQLRVWSCDNTAAERWTIEPDGTIRAMGMCMDVAQSGTANNTKVDLSPCNGQANQKWVHRSDSSLYSAFSDKCLDGYSVNYGQGSLLAIWACNGQTNQKWKLPGS